MTPALGAFAGHVPAAFSERYPQAKISRSPNWANFDGQNPLTSLFSFLQFVPPTNENIKLIKVETAEEMFQATQQNLPADIAIFSAAVTDFKINKKNTQKIKKSDNLTINLEKNIDILNFISNHNSMRPKLVIGFAAETNNVEENASIKLVNKNCDWIIANDVSKIDSGFESDYNEVTIHYKNDKKEKLAHRKKSEISEEIVDRIVNLMN